MKKRPYSRFLILITLLIIPLVWLFASRQGTTEVRGKSQAMPLSDTLTPEQTSAQALALADQRVIDLTHGRHTEVFGVHPVLAQQYTAAAAACATADCRQVEIYNFDDDTAVTALVNIESQQVLDVLHQPGMHPSINKRLSDRAIEIALNAPEVIEILGFRPESADMAPVEADSLGTSCDDGHLCAGPTFELSDRVLWAIVDLTDEKLAGIDWTTIDLTDTNPTPFAAAGCPPPGSANRDGWTLDYEVSNTDGLRVFAAAYDGKPVLTSVKLVEWHADYGSSGYRDATGCNPSGGFPIYPFGDTLVLDLTDDDSNVIGFEVVQDFRMSSWGNSCNYRYEQRLQFYEDGRFRIASGAYGKGCGNNALYRPVVRIDIAVEGDENDNFSRWDGSDWQLMTTEDYLVPYSEAGHGPHQISGEGYSWRIDDAGGAGYFIEQDIGQFGGRGSTPFLYPTLHKPAEGDTDLGGIGNCCNDSHVQGPEQYVNGENIENANIVLWYVPQMETEVAAGSYYCWTLSGDPNPVTYPCFSGPMFVPAAEPALAAFSHNAPVSLGDSVVFTNTSSGSSPITYTWNFGDGSGSNELNPSHLYANNGVYTVTLSAENVFGRHTFTDIVRVGVPATAAFSHSGPITLGEAVQFNNNSLGDETMSYLWDFGDGATATEANPSHSYAEGGVYEVSLTAVNKFGSSSVTEQVAVDTVLSVSALTASGGSVQNGDILTYTVILRNKGANAITTSLNDPIPAGTIYVVGTAQASSGPPPTLSGGALRWTGQVLPGTPVLVQFALKVQTDNDVINTAHLEATANNTRLQSVTTNAPGYQLTIDDGNAYTANPLVDLQLTWNGADNITEMQLSNHGDFRQPTAWMPADADFADWALSTDGDWRLPSTVFARFRNGTGQEFGPIHATILYDAIKPRITAVTLTPVSGLNVNVAVTTRDDESGTAVVQLSNDPTFAAYDTFAVTGPLTTIPWQLADEDSAVYARAVDRAGNVSAITTSAPKAYLPVVRK